MYRNHRFVRLFSALLFVVGLTSTTIFGQLSPELREKIDKVAANSLAKSGVPSASVAIVKDGQIVYVKAYGDARLEPKTAATPEMRYSIGSISKQFTAAAILLLQEQGKLSLDDKVAKYHSRSDARQRSDNSPTAVAHVGLSGLLAAGLRDADDAQADRRRRRSWTCGREKPLDFDPGTKWQYSNTNYVIAGVIIEKVARHAAAAVSAGESIHAAGDEERGDIDQEGWPTVIRLVICVMRLGHCVRRRKKARAGCSRRVSWR